MKTEESKYAPSLQKQIESAEEKLQVEGRKMDRKIDRNENKWRKVRGRGHMEVNYDRKRK